MKRILILYYSRYGGTKALAEQIADGVNTVTGCEALLRTVASVSANHQSCEPAIPEQGDLYCTVDDLCHCDGLLLGSPTRFGNMAAPLKFFIDQCSSLWLNGDLINKPAAVFTSTSSMHGGQESTLLSMSLPLIHLGMVILGVPYSEAALHTTRTGGTPYGASHVAINEHMPLSAEEKAIAVALGRRVAQFATLDAPSVLTTK